MERWSVNSIYAFFVGCFSSPAIRTYFTSPTWEKKLSSCSVVTFLARFPTYTVRLISSILAGSVFPGSGGYWRRPSAVSLGSWVVIICVRPVPVIWLMTLLGQLGVPGIMPAMAEGAIWRAVVSSGIFPSMTGTMMRALSMKTVLVKWRAMPLLTESSYFT